MACNALTRSETLDARKASVVHLAEKNDVREISRSYPWELGKLLSVVRSFNRLLDEVADYNAFWRSFLSFVLVIYVLLISFIIYICVFGRAAVIVNAAYVQVLLFHIVSVGGILFFSGAVVRKNESIVGTVIAMVGRRSLAARRWPSESAVATTVLAHLKVHSLNETSCFLNVNFLPLLDAQSKSEPEGNLFKWILFAERLPDHSWHLPPACSQHSHLFSSCSWLNQKTGPGDMSILLSNKL